MDPTTHYEGRPCKFCGGTLRYQSSRSCVSCQSDYNLDHRRSHPGSTTKWKRTRRGWAPGEHQRADSLLPHVKACAICNTTDPKTRTGKWDADHDHVTGKFRGHLCMPCNLRLGYGEKYGLPLSPAESVFLALGVH